MKKILFVLMLLASQMAWSHAGNNTETVVHACVNNTTKVLRNVGVSGACLSRETAGHWNIAGVKGDKGDAGIQGVPGVKGDKGEAGPAGSFGSFTYKIGATGPGGGFIFFVDYFDQYPGFTYLEAAPTDASAPTGIAWCNTSTSIPGATGWAANAVGRGRANTDAMLAVCGSGAARDADNYTTGSTVAGDWFLPSAGEAMLMSTNLRQAGVGDFANNLYWTSTEYDSNTALGQNLGGGNLDPNLKNRTVIVRAVRAF